MGSKDDGHRERKKVKKDQKKQTNISFEPQTTVEVIKKGKKSATEEE